MVDPAGGTATRARGHRAADVFGDQRSGTRHPVVAAAMALPPAALLAIVFGGWEAVVTQASSVAGMLGR
ncbi:hypothetical protein [Streptomyces sp. ME19-01-6]|uniref:hypothetical protein n=1 Tax=Streptomyces sp. ME19-01-6 TaxID=3028686 RepID=UPI0029BCA84F|nr:hypothetical protein [Streptomyces sp. ME19-01-6]MDX3228565.1 hypothetical protein [Streptomyces sp. ME19-01-6]